MNFLKYLTFFLLYSFSCYGEHNIETALNQLQTIFEEAENQQEPAAGYRVVLLYHQKTEDLEAVLDYYGKRRAGTAIAMPSEKDTFHSGSVQLKDNKLNQLLETRKIKLFRSKSDRLLLVPEEQISHWFEADRSRQISLLETAVAISRAIEEIFPESLTTDAAVPAEKILSEESRSVEIFCRPMQATPQGLSKQGGEKRSRRWAFLERIFQRELLPQMASIFLNFM